MQINITVEKMLAPRPEKKWYYFRAIMGGDGSPETSVICKGRVGWEPQPMETLTLAGEWVVYRGERQFQFNTAKLNFPTDPRAQLHYVCERTKGIGSSIEQAIWNVCGEGWKALQRGDVRKLTDAAYNNFMEAIQLFEGDREKAGVLSWLESKGCSAGMAADAYEAWKNDTAGIVNADCYRLAQLPGYSFKVVDENIRQNFGIADDDPRRIRSAVLYALQTETEDGSTAIDCFRHLSACSKLLPYICDDFIKDAVREMEENGSLRIFRKQGRMCLGKDWSNESSVYGFVRSALDQPEKSIPDDLPFREGLDFLPDQTQTEAVRFAVSRKFAVINGGAGVGKTTVIKMIVRGIKVLHPNINIHLCAPTGKAAARLKEASGIEATTIHVMLGSHGGDIFTAGPLDQSAVIVDESSMVDSALMAEIVKRNPAKLILVGDQAQLTPVGHGQPFHDIIGLFPQTVRTLTKCYRNTEAVFQAATQIRNGNPPPRHAESENERWDVVAASTPEQIQKLICAWAENGFIDFGSDIVLCPRNGKKNEQGQSYQEATVNALNEELRKIDREKRGGDSGEKFQSGDRVINTKNNPDHQVWNGTTGTVHSVNDENEVFVKLDVPVNIDGDLEDIILFDKDMVKNLYPAYALTVHKSQGSQYRKVIVAVAARDAFSFDRSLIYTAVTRTREECAIVGDYNAMIRGIENVRQKDTVMQCIAIEEESGEA